MPMSEIVVLGAVVAAFVVFMAVLGVVSWWSNRTDSGSQRRANPAVRSDATLARMRH